MNSGLFNYESESESAIEDNLLAITSSKGMITGKMQSRTHQNATFDDRFLR